MTRWVQQFREPLGTMPKGMIPKLAIGIGTILAIFVILTTPDGVSEDQSEGAAEGAGGGEAGVEAVSGESYVQQASDAVERMQAQAQRLVEARDEDLRLRRQMAADTAAREGLQLRVGESGELETLTPEDQLREELRLAEIRRRHEALRADPVALSLRPGPAPVAVADPPVAAEAVSPPAEGAPPLSPATASELAELQGLSGPLGVPEPADALPTPVTRPADPPGWERLYEGQFIEAVMATELRGEFEGPSVALVAAPLWSRDRQRILVPRGTRVLGRTAAVTSWGQGRLAVAFHRLVFPDGTYVRLTFDGLDQAGASGLRDQVNRHYLSTFGAAGAVGLIAGLTLRGSRPYEGGIEGARAGGAIGLGQSAQSILERYLNRLPSITIRAGSRLRVMLTSDLLVPRPAFEPRLFSRGSP